MSKATVLSWRNAVFALLLCLLPGTSALAVGIGEIQLHSQLGEPLRATIPLGHLGSLTNEQLIVRLAGEQEFDRLDIDRNAFHSNMKFNVQSDRRGNVWVDVQSERPLKEPFLDFVLEVRWPSGSLLKEFTLLMDLPG